MIKQFNQCLLLAAALLNTSSFALEEAQFDKIEYAFKTAEPAGLVPAPKLLSKARLDLYNFLDIDDKVSEKRIVYIDTPDRDLKKASLIVRIRQHMNKPEKSKITVKLRAPDPASFGELDDYKKAEIDINGEKKSYSVSYDIPYSPGQINIEEVDIEQVFAVIRKNKGEAWKMLQPIYEAQPDAFQQTIVMRSLEWDATMRGNNSFELEYALWSPLKPQNTDSKTGISEISFKGKTKNLEKLQKWSAQLHAALEDKQALNSIQGSKTSLIFSLSDNFPAQ